MNPNHYLAVAIHYLLSHRPQWPTTAKVGKTLKARGTPAFEPELVQVLIKGRELGDGKFIRYVDASRQLSIRWFSQLSASLTDEQREHLRGRLSELASDLDALSKN